MSIPVMSTTQLSLRPLQRRDAEDLFVYAQDELVARPGMWELYASFADCQAHVDSLVDRYESGLMWWALEDLEGKRVVGRVQLSGWSENDARAEISYALHRAYWGRGLMTEAVRAVAEYGWDTLNLHRLEATVLPNNAPSIRLLTSLGMKREGTLCDYRRLWGAWVDVDMYAVVKV